MKEFFDMNEKQDLQQLYEFNAEKHLFDSIKPSVEKPRADDNFAIINQCFNCAKI